MSRKDWEVQCLHGKYREESLERRLEPRPKQDSLYVADLETEC